MNKLMLSLGVALAAVIGLTASDNVALAKGGKGGSSPSFQSIQSNKISGNSGGKSGSQYSSGSFKSFFKNGKQFSIHYYNSSYHGWSSYCWFSHYHCYGYYCPSQCCWYYYCPQYSCYMPCSYMAEFPPYGGSGPQGLDPDDD